MTHARAMQLTPAPAPPMQSIRAPTHPIVHAGHTDPHPPTHPPTHPPAGLHDDMVTASMTCDNGGAS